MSPLSECVGVWVSIYVHLPFYCWLGVCLALFVYAWYHVNRLNLVCSLLSIYALLLNTTSPVEHTHDIAVAFVTRDFQTPRVWLFGYDHNHNPLKVSGLLGPPVKPAHSYSGVALTRHTGALVGLGVALGFQR